MHHSQEKIASLRSSMKEISIDAYIITNTDPHIGEYINDCWHINSWLTGFTGSASTVVVTDTFAGLWTDSRYFVQAEKQLAGSGIVLMKTLLPEMKDYSEWLIDFLQPGSRIGLDGRIFSIGRLRKIEALAIDKNIAIDIECDLISGIWKERPALSGSQAFDHPVEYCGKERSVKISEVREEMKRLRVDYHLLTSVDDIMWLLNIRGNDTIYSPLLYSFAIVDNDQILFFADEGKIPFKMAREFDNLGIILLPYEETAGMLSTLITNSSILITPGTTSASLYNSIPEGMKIIEDVSIPTRMKAIKNKSEILSIGKAMIMDGVALTKFFMWIEHNSDSVPMSELSMPTSCVPPFLQLLHTMSTVHCLIILQHQKLTLLLVRRGSFW